MSESAEAPVIGVVLAGGKSTRMGRDKSALCIDGETLLARQQGLLRDTGCSEVWCIGAQDSDWPLRDRLPAVGPIGGVLRAVEEARARFPATVELLVVPVDMPALQPALLQDLLAFGKNTAVAHFHSGPLPCVLRADAALQTILETQISAQRRDLRSAFALVGVKMFSAIEHDAALVNVNTPAEFAVFLEPRS